MSDISVASAIKAVSHARDSVKGALHEVTKSLDNNRINLATVTKTLQAASAALHLAGMPVFASIIESAADTTFCWSIFQWPQKWHFPITAERIDAHKTLESLLVCFTNTYGKRTKAQQNAEREAEEKQAEEKKAEDDVLRSGGVGGIIKATENTGDRPDPKNMAHSYKVIDIQARLRFKQLLDTASSELSDSAPYRNTEDLILAFEKRLNNLGQVSANVEIMNGELKLNGLSQLTQAELDQFKAKGGDEREKGFDFTRFKLTGFKVTLIQTSLMQKVANVAWFLVDIVTPTMFLKIWKLLDLSKLAQSIGQFKVYARQPFAFVNRQPVEVWVRGLIVTGLIVNLISITIRLVKYASLDDSDKSRLKYDAAACLTDFAYHGLAFVRESGLRAIPLAYIHAFNIVARTIGIYCIFYRPKSKYIEVLSKPFPKPMPKTIEQPK